MSMAMDTWIYSPPKWTEKRVDPDNPKAEAWIFYGDGKGNFRLRGNPPLPSENLFENDTGRSLAEPAGNDIGA